MRCANDCGRAVFSVKTDICRRCRETERNRLRRLAHVPVDLPAAIIEAMLRRGDAARRARRWTA